MPIGSEKGGFVDLDARLQVGHCIGDVRRNDDDGGLLLSASSNDCANPSVVSGNRFGSAGVLRITASLTKPSSVDVCGLVSGDPGGTARDIPNGQLTSAGALSIQTRGAPENFQSPSFLALPEPAAALISSVLTLGFPVRRWNRR